MYFFFKLKEYVITAWGSSLIINIILKNNNKLIYLFQFVCPYDF